MKDMPMYEDFAVIEPISRGHSTDRKYYVETLDGQKLLLKISDISDYDGKKEQFEIIKAIDTLDINMTCPVDFGVFDNGKSVYMLLTWVDGESLHEKLPYLPVDEQYRLGVIAGDILRKIHSLAVPGNIECSYERYAQRFDYRIKSIQKYGIKTKHEKKILDFLDGNKHLCFGRFQSIRHGDFHSVNLLLTKQNGIGVIDFGSADYGDPYEEFGRLVWNALTAPAFARGQINGYFENDVPDGFFDVATFYMLGGVLSSLFWANQFAKDKMQMYIDNIDLVIQWYDDLTTTIPNWYNR